MSLCLDAEDFIINGTYIKWQRVSVKSFGKYAARYYQLKTMQGAV